MSRHFKSILPTLALAVVVIALGAYILVAVGSEERKAQQAWNKVLEMDAEVEAKARRAMVLVEKLEVLETQSAEGSEEARVLRVELVEVWPNFSRSNGDGELILPPTDEMKTKLICYIKHG